MASCLRCMTGFRRNGARLTASQQDSRSRECSPQPDPHQLATIIYTSGTSGRPKGVMLSHHNILTNAHSCLQVVPIRPDDLLLSFLPLSHTFERTGGYYVPMMGGATVAYARSVHQLQEDLLTIRPTILVSVPRIYERILCRNPRQAGGRVRR